MSGAATRGTRAQSQRCDGLPRVVTVAEPWTRVRQEEHFCAHRRSAMLATLASQIRPRTGGRRRDGGWRVRRAVIA